MVVLKKKNLKFSQYNKRIFRYKQKYKSRKTKFKKEKFKKWRPQRSNWRAWSAAMWRLKGLRIRRSRFLKSMRLNMHSPKWRIWRYRTAWLKPFIVKWYIRKYSDRLLRTTSKPKLRVIQKFRLKSARPSLVTLRPLMKIKFLRTKLAEKINSSARAYRLKRILRRRRRKLRGSINLKHLYCINILSTKTNHFCSITTFQRGHMLFLETPRMQGFQHTTRRRDTSLITTLQRLFKKFFRRFRRKKFKFILQFRGNKSFLVRKVYRFLTRRLKLRSKILYMQYRQTFTHNGCRLEIRKRRKRKGKVFNAKRRNRRFT